MLLLFLLLVRLLQFAADGKPTRTSHQTRQVPSMASTASPVRGLLTTPV